MNRDFVVLFLGTFKLIFLIGITLSITSNKNKRNEIAIPIICAFVFMWVSWAVTYISQINPFILPEIEK